MYRRLDDQSPIFPLQAEPRDYERLSFPLLVAANQAIMSEMESSIVKQ